LALLRKENKVCEFDAYKSTITDLLARSIALDEKRRARMLKDTDLDTVKDTFRFQMLAKKSLKKPSDLRAMLTAISWFGPSPGAFGPNPLIDFAEDGSVSLSEMDTSGDEIKRTSTKGTFTISGAQIKVELNGKTYVGTLKSTGQLEIKDLATFTDDPSECDA
jgi:hypothetical protein